MQNPPQLKRKRGKKVRRAASAANRPARVQPQARQQRRRQTASSPSEGAIAIQNHKVTLPLTFFMEPLRHAMAAAIRPPTAQTRRRQRVIEMPMPLECFLQLLHPFKTGEIQDLEWLNQEKSALKPTMVSGGCKTYNYKVRQPSQINKLFDMAQWDRPIPGTPWRRGLGAQRLHLTQAAGQRGRRTMLMASAAGNVSVRLREYSEKMPIFRLVCGVMTLGHNNSILFNADYSRETRAALRSMATAGLRRMADDDLYPTLPASTVATAMAIVPTSSIWQPPMAAAPTAAAQAADADDAG